MSRLEENKCNHRPLPAYIPSKITNYDYEVEKEKYTTDFIKNNNCNKYNPYTEFIEYWNGLNVIRKKYGLKELIFKETPCGYGYMTDENY